MLAVIDSKEEGGSRLNTPYMVCMWTVIYDIFYVTECSSNSVYVQY